MSEQRNYMAEIQALIDQKWKENPEEMKRVMAENKAKEKEKAKAKTHKWRYFDPHLTKELIKELSQGYSSINISKVQDLVERGADVKAKNYLGWTPLHKACGKDNLEFAKLLIDRGADVEAKNKWGETPLHLACDNNDLECAKLLLDRGADVNAENKDGETPLHWAKSEEMRDLLQKYM